MIASPTICEFPNAGVANGKGHQVDLSVFLPLFRTMSLARELDRREQELVSQGEAFFHVSGAGHEGSAVLARHLTKADWLHLHYRDKALMLERGMPLVQFFHSLFCNAASHSQGRQMSAHFADPSLNLLSLVGPVGNNALQAVGVARELRYRAENQVCAAEPGADDAIVVCSMGDGTAQQGEVLEAIAEAVREDLRVLFWIEDNGYSISTKTRGRTFFNTPAGPAREFYGLPIHRIRGWEVVQADRCVASLISEMRSGVGPALVVFEVERLTHHTSADDERVYRGAEELEQIRASADPLLRLAEVLRDVGVSEESIENVQTEARQAVLQASEEALAVPGPQASLDARAPRFGRSLERRSVERQSVEGESAKPLPTASSAGPDQPVYTLREAMREVLRRHLAKDDRVSLYGEDIEDPKGDVFGLTRGLSRAFPAQVKNSPLSESTILGVSIGRALAGGRPVACVQFADFLPLAFNQIASELGSIYWRTAGGYQCPAVVVAPCGAYRPGLGPFHAQTFESVLAHIPGLDVYMPSSAADAASLLNTALQSEHPTLFLYPKVCLNDPALACGEEALAETIEPGTARFISRGNELTLVSWGSTMPLCQRAIDALGEAGIECDLIDLRTISPWDQEAVCESVGRTGRLLVVHEDNQTCGFGAEVMATVAEVCGRQIAMRRITRPDTYIPCNYSNQLEVLPSLRRILEAAASLVGLTVRWEAAETAPKDVFVINAAGASPADQNITVIEWKVQEGGRVQVGEVLAECEADKATFDLVAPKSGTITSLHPAGKTVHLGEPLAKIVERKIDRKETRSNQVSVASRPLISRLGVRWRKAGPARCEFQPARARIALPAISCIQAVLGSDKISNEELASRFPNRSASDILERTGIETRRQVSATESALSLATSASRNALARSGLQISDLDAIIVSTSTPQSILPSMACLLHHELCQSGEVKEIAAWDVSAACTGYVYALTSAFDWCCARPAANVLVVTTEAMSQFVDPGDFETAILFGDAATATVVHGPHSRFHKESPIRLHRPTVSAKGENGSILSLGRCDSKFLQMNGGKVFANAVRHLIESLRQACTEHEIGLEDLAFVIPHQANGRILEAVERRLALPNGRLLNRIRDTGNTGSSTIPVVLAELLAQSPQPSGKAGLCAFGGGFTFGAAILELGS